MNPLIRRLAREAAAPLEKMVASLLKKMGLIFFALICLFFASAFLTLDLYEFIQTLAGTTIAGISVGGLYLAIAIICVAVALRPATTAGEVATDQAESAHATALAAPAETADTRSGPQSEFARTIDDMLAPFLVILKEAGQERESAAIEAGAAIAKHLKPFPLIAFMIFAGFILGRGLRQRK
jgi:hypothetical protein